MFENGFHNILSQTKPKVFGEEKYKSRVGKLVSKYEVCYPLCFPVADCRSFSHASSLAKMTAPDLFSIPFFSRCFGSVLTELN